MSRKDDDAPQRFFARGVEQTPFPADGGLMVMPRTVRQWARCTRLGDEISLFVTILEPTALSGRDDPFPMAG